MESLHDFMIAHGDHEPVPACSAVFPDSGLDGLSSRPFHRATGKSPEPAGRKTCATFWIHGSLTFTALVRSGTLNRMLQPFVAHAIKGCMVILHGSWKDFRF